MNHANTVRRRLAGRLTHLLVASAVGIYLLLVVGATTAVLDATSACQTWPACEGLSPPGEIDLAVVVAIGHRAVAVAVGVVLAATTVGAVSAPAPARVAVAVALAVVLYPAQVGLGALTALTGAAAPLPALHLLVALVIFTAIYLALLWQLEATTPAAGDAPSSAHTDPDAPAAADTHPDAVRATDSLTGRDATGSTASTKASADTEQAAPDGFDTSRQRIVAYVRLTKPKLWWLLCLVALAAMVLAGGRSLDLGTIVATLGGGVLAIAASGTFNNVIERDVDRRMERTADRPTATGRVPVRRTITFAVALALASVVVFVAFVNVLSAVLGLLAILYYSVGYTLVLKPNTDQNVVIGGAVGAFPAFIGWAAVTDTVGVPALVLGGVVFLWTPAHFYNLALAYKEDYQRAGFPMLPVSRGEATTRRHILLYLGATMLATAGLGATTTLDWPFAAASVLLGGVFLWAVVRLYRERTERAAVRTFHAANAYLGGVLLAILLDGVVL